ncbi:MAG: hypothetical protein AAF655_17650 [Bacteroidota bacterium]
MQYHHAPLQNYEDFSSGRVIYHKSGLATFPVRLAIEIMGRCLSYFPEKKVKVYDPLCGEAYLLTVVGFWYHKRIEEIIGSDISAAALEFAAKNLGLLGSEGLAIREKELIYLHTTYQKPTHQDALESLQRLREKASSPSVRLFEKDALQPVESEEQGFLADVILTDAPYGQMISWAGGTEEPLENMLTHLSPVLSLDGLVAIVTHKQQKVNHQAYLRVEKFGVGKRKVEILRKVN